MCGDHLSPISDTIILRSTGVGCNHINHVESQMKYGMVVAVITFLAYMVAGLFDTQWLGLLFGLLGLLLIGLV